jgi:hypothetical protein
MESHVIIGSQETQGFSSGGRQSSGLEAGKDNRHILRVRPGLEPGNTWVRREGATLSVAQQLTYHTFMRTIHVLSWLSVGQDLALTHPFFIMTMQEQSCVGCGYLTLRKTASDPLSFLAS